MFLIWTYTNVWDRTNCRGVSLFTNVSMRQNKASFMERLFLNSECPFSEVPLSMWSLLNDWNVNLTPGRRSNDSIGSLWQQLYTLARNQVEIENEYFVSVAQLRPWPTLFAARVAVCLSHVDNFLLLKRIRHLAYQ